MKILSYLEGFPSSGRDSVSEGACAQSVVGDWLSRLNIKDKNLMSAKEGERVVLCIIVRDAFLQRLVSVDLSCLVVVLLSKELVLGGLGCELFSGEPAVYNILIKGHLNFFRVG
jgi:hypothetical protein